MTGRPVAIAADTGMTERSSRFGVALLLYALAGGVLWWTFHLVVLAAAVPATCDWLPYWVLTAVNVVSLAGVVSAVYVSVVVMRSTDPAGAVNGRSRFLGVIALLFNAASLALVVLESVPVYVLDPCR
jgi:hypothetical protein